MKHIHELLRDRILSRAGIHERKPAPKFTLRDLEKSEWSSLFETLMRNRMLMGAFRYGTLERKRRIGAKWDLVGSIEGKIRKYKETGNTELLVDIANYCLIEFECGVHPSKHFNATDDEDHCKTK